MSLLRRIAISRGDRERKMAANSVLAGLDRVVVADWNKALRAEINEKSRKELSKQTRVRVYPGRQF